MANQRKNNRYSVRWVFFTLDRKWSSNILLVSWCVIIDFRYLLKPLLFWFLHECAKPACILKNSYRKQNKRGLNRYVKTLKYCTSGFRDKSALTGNSWWISYCGSDCCLYNLNGVIDDDELVRNIEWANPLPVQTGHSRIQKVTSWLCVLCSEGLFAK